jgi:hypothetical protein
MTNKGIVCLVFILVLAVIRPTDAAAEMYVEGYVGYAKSATVFKDYLTLTTQHPYFNTYEENHTRGTFRPAVMGGGKLGLWFTQEGFLGTSYPEWMKYLGCYLDLNYHNQNFRTRVGSSICPTADCSLRNTFSSNGNTFTLAFMVAARCGFLKNETVPFGRLQPYFAVGPAILIATQDINLQSSSQINGVSVLFNLNPGAQTVVVPALQVEPGLRWMVRKNFSLDLAFKFRWAHPSFTYTYLDPLDHTKQSITLNPQYLILSLQLGAAYHF